MRGWKKKDKGEGTATGGVGVPPVSSLSSSSTFPFGSIPAVMEGDDEDDSSLLQQQQQRQLLMIDDMRQQQQQQQEPLQQLEDNDPMKYIRSNDKNYGNSNHQPQHHHHHQQQQHHRPLSFFRKDDFYGRTEEIETMIDWFESQCQRQRQRRRSRRQRQDQGCSDVTSKNSSQSEQQDDEEDNDEDHLDDDAGVPMLLLDGPMGTGKTRLIHEFLNESQALQVLSSSKIDQEAVVINEDDGDLRILSGGFLLNPPPPTTTTTSKNESDVDHHQKQQQQRPLETFVHAISNYLAERVDDNGGGGEAAAPPTTVDGHETELVFLKRSFQAMLVEQQQKKKASFSKDDDDEYVKLIRDRIPVLAQFMEIDSETPQVGSGPVAKASEGSAEDVNGATDKVGVAADDPISAIRLMGILHKVIKIIAQSVSLRTSSTSSQPSAQPLILVLDNLQWADPFSRALLSLLVVQQKQRNQQPPKSRRMASRTSTTSSSSTNCAHADDSNLSIESSDGYESNIMIIGAYRRSDYEGDTGYSSSLETDADTQPNQEQKKKNKKEKRDAFDTWIDTLSQLSSVECLHVDNHSEHEIADFLTGFLLNTSEPDLGDDTSDYNRSDGLSKIASLARLIHRKTDGCMLYVKRALEELSNKGVLQFNFATCTWEWDDSQLQQNDPQVTGGVPIATNSTCVLSMSENVVQSNVAKLRTFPPPFRLVMTVAALIKNSFDPFMVHDFFESLDTVGSPLFGGNGGYNMPMKRLLGIINRAVGEGILETQVIPVTPSIRNLGNEGARTGGTVHRYKFTNESIQEAAAALLPTSNDDGATLRIQMGKFLLDRAKTLGRTKKDRLSARKIVPSGSPSPPSSSTDWMLLVAAEHLNSVADQVERGNSISHKIDPVEFAQLNLDVGTMAVQLCAFPVAAENFAKGIRLMERHREQRDHQGTQMPSSWDPHYELMYDLYRSSAEARHIIGDYAVCDQHCQQVLDHTKHEIERMPIYRCMESSLSRQGRHLDAMRLNGKMAAAMGIYPKRWKRLQMVRDMVKVKGKLLQYSNQDILQLPIIQDGEAHHLAVMSALARIALRATLCNDFDRLLLVSLRGILYTINHGLCGDGAVLLAYYGGIACCSLGDRATGLRLGRLATQIVELCHARSVECWVNMLVAYSIESWSAPLTECLKKLQTGFQAGVDTGDVEGAGWNGFCSNVTAFQTGFPLRTVLETGNILLEHYDRYKISSCRSDIYPLLLHYQQLMGSKMVDWDAIRVRLRFQPDRNLSGMNFEWLLQACIAYYMGKFDLAELAMSKWLGTGKSKGETRWSYFTSAQSLFFQGLISSARGRKTRNRQCKEQARKAMKEMCRSVKAGGLNDLHKAYIMDAEFSASFHRKAPRSTQRKFDLAISVSSKAGLVQDAALGNELAGEYFFRMGDSHWATTYFTRAVSLYKEWGALAKVEQLFKERSQYLNKQALSDRRPSLALLSDRYQTWGKASSLMGSKVDIDDLTERGSAADLSAQFFVEDGISETISNHSAIPV